MTPRHLESIYNILMHRDKHPSIIFLVLEQLNHTEIALTNVWTHFDRMGIKVERHMKDRINFPDYGISLRIVTYDLLDRKSRGLRFTPILYDYV